MTYLSESGWAFKRKDGNTKIYRKNLSVSWEEVIVPDSSAYSDYAQMVSLILETLSKVESRSEEEIASDIISGNVNESLQYRLMVGDNSGTVPLDWIIQVLQANKKMSAAAYLDIVDYCPYYTNISRGNKALRDMRMGQTSYGSFIVKIIYPYPTELQRTIDNKYAGDKALREIANKIIVSSRTVVESAADNSSINENAKISYNFVDSLLSLRSDNGHDLEMMRSGPISDVYSPLNIPDSIFSRIEYIADEMKPKSITEMKKFTGRLYSSNEIQYDEQITKFKMEYFDENGSAKANIVLEGQERRMALQSITDHTLVSLEGKLSGYGNRKMIEDIQNFHIIG